MKKCSAQIQIGKATIRCGALCAVNGVKDDHRTWLRRNQVGAWLREEDGNRSGDSCFLRWNKTGVEILVNSASGRHTAMERFVKEVAGNAVVIAG